MTNYEKVREMHKKYGLGLDLANPPKEMIENRLGMIDEEIKELKQAVKQDNRLKTLDALGDILYVVYGMGAELGLPLDKAFDRIHTSNMSKEKPNNSKGKLIKGENYIPVNLTDLVCTLNREKHK